RARAPAASPRRRAAAAGTAAARGAGTTRAAPLPAAARTARYGAGEKPEIVRPGIGWSWSSLLHADHAAGAALRVHHGVTDERVVPGLGEDGLDEPAGGRSQVE